MSRLAVAWLCLAPVRSIAGVGGVVLLAPVLIVLASVMDHAWDGDHDYDGCDEGVAS